jgi:hypothetical protein
MLLYSTVVRRKRSQTRSDSDGFRRNGVMLAAHT